MPRCILLDIGKLHMSAQYRDLIYFPANISEYGIAVIN